ncbi:MAG: hypothetical protein JWM80_64 [Cyanobacteria bacterium RYN_339]|nr:hypothetical protein [Cyanobacteria bacterium RYN_339]
MEDLFSKLSRYARSQPAGSPEPDAAPESVDWREEYAREHGVAFRRVQPAEPAADDEGLTWQQEFAREHGLEGATKRPLSGGGPVWGSERAPAQLPPAPADFPPELIPATFIQYRALLNRVMEPPTQRFAAELTGQPYARAAFDAWKPGALKPNLNIVYELYDRICPLMGGIYGFEPAGLGYEPNMSGMWGLYVPAQRKVMLAELLLHQHVREVFATIIHEQVHALQHDMQRRLFRPAGRPLTHGERALAYYWQREDRIIRGLYAKAMADIAKGRGDAAYRRIAKEHHAFETEEFVVRRLVRML